MTYLPPPLPETAAPARRTLGLAIAVGSAVAIVCAFVVGLIGGATNTQFTFAAILLGVFVGQAVRRIRRDTQAAIAAGLISLVGSALASLIALTMRLVRAVHIPLSIVLAHMPRVISAMPHVIGGFGFLSWALAAYAGWVSVGGPRIQRARMRAETAAVGYGQTDGPDQQPGGSPAAQPDHSGSGFTVPPDQAPGFGPTQMPDG